MIDVRRLRVDLDATKVALARKGVPAADVERAATLDVEHRRMAREAEDVRGRVKVLSKQVGEAMRAGEAAKAEALREESRLLGNELATVEREGSKTERQLRDALLRLPNLPAPEAPDGTSEADNVVVRTVGYDPSRYGPHQRVAHWDIGAELRILDMERGAKILGLDVRSLPGPGRHSRARPLPDGPGPKFRRVYGSQAADPRAHAGDGSSRPVAQVRR